MIYVHIPFCDSKCYYCNFNSGVYSSVKKENYFKLLKQEITEKANQFKDYVVSSIYIGGGTPSSVDSAYIRALMECLKSNYNICKDAEISVEANPCSTTLNKLKEYKSIGINRISFGVQSLSNKLLKLIGRNHDKKTAINSIKIAKTVGIHNVNADLLIGIPNQSFSDIKNSVKKLVSCGVTHISAYMLINEKGTKLTKMIESGLKTVSEDKSVKYYDKLVKFLSHKNFNRYEISNFSKFKKECNHNIGYWDMKEYVGFGLSAHSFYQNTRFENNNNFDEYLKGNFTISNEKLDNREIIEETIMLGLRQSKGLNLQKLKNLGYDIKKEKKKEIESLVSNGFVKIQNDFIKIDENKFGVTNQIILKLIP